MGRPKALITWRGRTFVEHVVALAAQCGEVVVVGGAVELPPLPAPVVHNPDWQVGPLSTLQVGLRQLHDASAVLVLTVDRPHVAPSTIGALLRARIDHPAAVIQPRYDGRHGHPILHPRVVVDALLALPAAGNARQVVRDPATQRHFVDVDDGAVVDNIDTPEDLARLPA
jgi:CTP:molybdopterin cytidylyltransferase MocA